MRRAAALVVMFAACGSDSEPPPFRFAVQERTASGVVVEAYAMVFDSYAAGLASPPITIELHRGTSLVRATARIGYCEHFPCAGDIVLEKIAVDANSPFGVVGATCEGTRGSVYAGIDADYFGSCETLGD